MKIVKSMLRIVLAYAGLLMGLGVGFAVLIFLKYAMGENLGVSSFGILFISTCAWMCVVGYAFEHGVQDVRVKEVMIAGILFAISIQWVPFEIAVNEWNTEFIRAERNIMVIIIARIALSLLFAMTLIPIFVGIIVAKMRLLDRTRSETNVM